MWLFRLPRVARHSPACARIEAVISFAVVLPLLPATPTSGPAKCARQLRAARSSAACVSGTTICGSASGCAAPTTAPAAPACSAAPTKSWPLKFGPCSATNSCPRERARVAHHVGEGAIRPLQAPAAGACEFFQRALHAGSLASSALTTAWSRNSRRSLPVIW